MSVLEKIMVQIHVPFPYATALFVATVEFACGAGLTLGLLTPLCAAMLTGDMIVAGATTSIHTIQATRSWRGSTTSRTVPRCCTC